MAYGNQKKVDQMDALNGRMLREDNSAANIASIMSPKFIAFEKITVGSTAVGLTAATYAGATVAEVTFETAAVRVRRDGTAPTAETGTPFFDKDVLLLTSSDQIAKFKAIRSGATDATIQVAYGV